MYYRKTNVMNMLRVTYLYINPQQRDVNGKNNE